MSELAQSQSGFKLRFSLTKFPAGLSAPALQSSSADSLCSPEQTSPLLVSVNQGQGLVTMVRPLWRWCVLNPHLLGLGLCRPRGLGMEQRGKCFYFPSPERGKVDPTQPVLGNKSPDSRGSFSAHQEGVSNRRLACGHQCQIWPIPTFRADINAINFLVLWEPSVGRKAIAYTFTRGA